MKHAAITIGALALAIMVLSVSGLAMADSDTLSPGEVLTEEFHLSTGDWVTYSWTSSSPLAFTIRDPDGNLVESSTSSSDAGIYTADQDGTHVFTWTNNQASTVTITYDTTRFSLGGDGGLFEDLWMTMLIVAAVIIVVVVVIIVLVVYVLGKDKKPAAPQYPQQMQMPPPGVPLTNCPRCGAPLDTNAMFCQKCGQRVK